MIVGGVAQQRNHVCPDQGRGLSGGTPSGCSCRGGENRAGKDAQRIRVRWEWHRVRWEWHRVRREWLRVRWEWLRVRWEWLSALHEGQARLEVVSVSITTTSAHEHTHTEGGMEGGREGEREGVGREGGRVTERGRVRRELVMRKGPLPL